MPKHVSSARVSVKRSSVSLYLLQSLCAPLTWLESPALLLWDHLHKLLPLKSIFENRKYFSLITGSTLVIPITENSLLKVTADLKNSFESTALVQLCRALKVCAL